MPVDPRPAAPRASPVGVVPLLTLGVTLARRGLLATAAIVIAVGTAAVLAVLGIGLAGGGEGAPLQAIPLLASSWIAWGGGFLLAFSAAVHALRRDRAEGLRHLLESRALGLRGYLVARVGGLATLLALVVAGGTLLTGLAATLAALRVGAALRALQATCAGLAFAVAFAVVLAPLAFAALGARSRVGGYFFLIGIMVLPELAASLLAGVLPDGIAEVLAIPSALDALRSALAPGGFDPLRLARAIVALSAFAGIAIFLVRRDVLLLEAEER